MSVSPDVLPGSGPGSPAVNAHLEAGGDCPSTWVPSSLVRDMDWAHEFGLVHPDCPGHLESELGLSNDKTNNSKNSKQSRGG